MILTENTLTNDGLLLDERYLGRVEKREIKKKRYFRCQRFGHLAWPCQETPSATTAAAKIYEQDASARQSTLPGVLW